jgi:NADH:ubiquinone oxidoreductase subunit 5 (subunit L)/multisubunit Na+/H+ antiporter MnhA subunit/multisubunit Na+/H+ antiporter MnhB subunit
MDFSLLVLLLAPFVLAPFLPALGRLLGAKTGWVALLAPVASFTAACQLKGLPVESRSVARVWEWIPSLGVNLSFTPDGLALLYALIVSGVGILVVFYAACYLDDHHYRDHGKFYCYLLLFMGAMLVTVMSSNLLLLFVAWEMTGLTSFLLIGFLHDKPESQRGARMALLTTGLTGLVLLAGVVLLRVIYGTYDFAEILAQGGVPAGSETLMLAAFVCCFIGIAGKSAQFPFHYWLPNAMAAPTPVSAYLHSATMVKLGVFLTARMLPLFNGLDAWMPVLTGIGFGTFLLGAVLALLSQDLKAVLANTTVAQLGLLIGYYGLHTQGVPVPWDALHILNHVFYKACLFMVVGIIDHSTGTRDLRQLGGLWRKMPLVGTAALLALAAFAGLPPTTGFLSKEMLLTDLYALFHTHGGLQGVWPLAAIALGSAINVAVAARVVFGAFFGKTTHAVEEHYHAPSLGLQLSPMLLGGLTLVCGLAATAFGAFTLSFGDSAGRTMQAAELHLWHGVTPELITSTVIVAAGLVLFFAVGRARWDRVSVPGWMRFDLAFDKVADGVPYAARAFNRMLGYETPYSFLYVVCGVMVLVPACFLIPHWSELAADSRQWSWLPSEPEGWLRWVVVLLTGGAALCAALWRRVIPQLFAVSVVGVGVTFYYVLYQGPDLATTQILVESATLLLVLLVVLRLKRDGADTVPLPASRGGVTPKVLRVLVSVGGGLLLGGGVLLFQQKPDASLERAGDDYLAQSEALAKGTNVVNTTVIDFRGFDTMFEIMVLVIAALGCLGLIARRRTGGMRGTFGPGDKDLFPVPRDFILRMIVKAGFVPLNLFAVYIFLRGHNLPGGGFPAGLISALSLILMAFVVGVQGVRNLVRINPISIAIGGVFLALAAALFPALVQGLPVLHHFHVYLGGFYLGGAFWFDLGVYLAVVGTSLKIILPLMKSVHGMPAFVQEEEARFASLHCEPIDLQPDDSIVQGKTKGGAPQL